MVLIGCTPQGRLTEQHDVVFAAGRQLKDIVPSIIKSWPEANGAIHIDVWREVKKVDGYRIELVQQEERAGGELKLFFINLGGYRKNEFEEYHYKQLVVAPDLSTAIKRIKNTEFYREAGFKGAESHIDDKYDIELDEIVNVEEVLAGQGDLRIKITPASSLADDLINPGYLQLKKLMA